MEISHSVHSYSGSILAMSKIDPAECPCCGQVIRRIWVMDGGTKIGMKFRDHVAPCGLPCKLKRHAESGETVHDVTDLCEKCIALKETKKISSAPEYTRPLKDPATAPSAKIPLEDLIIPPHAIKMAKSKAGLSSDEEAISFINKLYPLSEYNSSQEKTSSEGDEKFKPHRIDLYTVYENGEQWVFYMKKNILMTIHKMD